VFSLLPLTCPVEQSRCGPCCTPSHAHVLRDKCRYHFCRAE
jgi:hypothetical protein